MASRELNIFVDTEQGRLVQSEKQTITAQLPRFVFGDSLPVVVRMLKPNTSDPAKPWSELDLTNQNIRIAIGNAAGKATAGTFTLTCNGNTTSSLAFSAEAAAVQTALNALASVTAAGGVTVTKSTGGAFRIVWNTFGAKQNITVDSSSLYPTTGAFAPTAQEGDSDTKQIQLIRFETSPASYSELSDPIPAPDFEIERILSADELNFGDKITFDPPAASGHYSLTYDTLGTTYALPFDASASEIQVAIQAVVNAAYPGDIFPADQLAVTVSGTYPEYVAYYGTVVGIAGSPTINPIGLKASEGRKGILNLNTAGIVELLNGESSAQAKLEIELYDTVTGEVWTPAQVDCTVIEDVIPNSPPSTTPLPEYVTGDQLANLVTQEELAAVSESIETIGNNQPPFALYANAAAEGTPLTIFFSGDSTYWGYLDGGAQANPTPIDTCQAILRKYYNNTAFTCINGGVSGWRTTDVMELWDTYMTDTPAQIVVIGFCVNDAQTGTTATQYAENLRILVTKAQAKGKLVILETPVPVDCFNGFGDQVKSERVKHFAEVMRVVAAGLNVPLHDTFAHFENVLDFGNPSLIINDGIHPTQIGYDFRGRWQANLFMRAAELKQTDFVPAIQQSIRTYDVPGDFFATQINAGSKGYYARFSGNAQIPVVVTSPDCDVLVATPLWIGGGVAVTFKVNGSTVHTQSINVAALSGPWAADHEVMVLKRPRPGTYLIEISGGANAVYYVRSRPSCNRLVSAILPGGTVSAQRNWTAQGSIELSNSSGSGQNVMLSDISISSALGEAGVEFRAKLDYETGFVLYGLRSSDGSQNIPGLLFYIPESNGFLTGVQGAFGFSGLATIGAVNLYNVEHLFRFIVRANKSVDCYVDDEFIGNYVPTLPYTGGVLGLYTNGASKSITLRDLRTF